MKNKMLKKLSVYIFMFAGCSDNNDVINSYNTVYQVHTEDVNTLFTVQYVTYNDIVKIDTVKGAFGFSTQIYTDSIGITANILEPKENDRIKAMLYIDDVLVKEETKDSSVSISYFPKE